MIQLQETQRTCIHEQNLTMGTYRSYAPVPVSSRKNLHNPQKEKLICEMKNTGPGIWNPIPDLWGGMETRLC